MTEQEQPPNNILRAAIRREETMITLVQDLETAVEHRDWGVVQHVTNQMRKLVFGHG